MFGLVGRWAVRHPWLVVLAWVALAAGVTRLAPDWRANSHDDDIRHLPAHYPSVRAFALMERAFPRDVYASRAVFALERADGEPLGADDLAAADAVAGRLRRLKSAEPGLGVSGVMARHDGPVGTRLTAADGRCTLIQLSLNSPYLALKTRDAVDRAEVVAREALSEAEPDGAVRLYVTGPAGVGRDLIAASAASLDHTTVATIILVIVVLLCVYRSPVMAMIPLITIGLAVWVSVQVLALVTLIPGVRLVNISQVFAVVILFGAGTDYCLFLISRYREELEGGQTARVGLNVSVSAVGGALAASAGTVMCGLGMMGFAEFGKIRCAGPVIALTLAIGVLAALTLTPALLRIVGRKGFWPFKVQAVLPGRARHGAWNAIADLVCRRPGLILAAALAALVPLALFGTKVKPSFRPVGDLNPASESVMGLEALKRHFTAGETGPITLLLACDDPWTGDRGRELVSHLSSGLALLPNVAEVRSLTQPLGPNALPAAPEPEPAGVMGMLRAMGAGVESGVVRVAAEGHYLAQVARDAGGPAHVTRLDVVLKSDPFEDASVATLGQIEAWMAHLLPARSAGMPAVFHATYGVTVHTRDMAQLVARDRARVNALVMGGVFLILLVVVRKLWLASYLLGTVLLSYYATLGLTALFASAITGRPVDSVEWRVPFFLFTILVAVGEDYNILLISRVLQEQARHGLMGGLRRGLAATGGTITACGLIMAGTFGTLVLAQLSTLMQIGFALGVGVLMDTFVIRPFVVPALLAIVWRDREAREAAVKPPRDAQPVLRPFHPPARRAA